MIEQGSAQISVPISGAPHLATKHLSKGFNPLWVANQIGTSPEMIYKHYAVYLQKAWTPTGQVTSKRVRKELENQKVS